MNIDIPSIVKNNRLFHLIAIAIIAIITVSPTLSFFFYRDDFAYLYNFEHSLTFNYPNHNSMIFLRPVYELFGFNPIGYFAYGMFWFAISAITMYLFACKIFNNRSYGFITALVYASSPIGIDTVSSMCTYASAYFLITALFLILLSIHTYHSTKKFRYFGLALLLLTSVLFFLPARTFLFVPIIILYDYMFHKNKPNLTLSFFIRHILLLLIFLTYYVFMRNIYHSNDTLTVNGLINELFTYPVKYPMISHTIIGIANVVAGTPLALSVNDATFANTNHPHLFSLLIFSITAMIAYFGYIINKKLFKIILFSFLWIVCVFYGFYFFSSPSSSETTSRAMTLTLPGYSMLFISLSSIVITIFQNIFIKKVNTKLWFTVTTVLGLVIFNMYVSMNRISFFGRIRSEKAQNFYQQMIAMYPSLPKGAILYFIDSKNPPMRSYLIAALGVGYYDARAAVGAFYKMKWEDMLYADNPEQLEEYMKATPEELLDDWDYSYGTTDIEKRIEQIYAFYYAEDGLYDVSDQVKQELQIKYIDKKL
jgi:hypothetical protein